MSEWLCFIKYMCILVLILAVLWSIPALSAAPSNVSLIATPNPAGYWGQITLTATVSPPQATGRVTFYDGVSVLGIVPVSSGSAVLNTRAATTGPRSLRAYYSGDTTYTPSSSAPVIQTVNAIGGSGFTAIINPTPPSQPDATSIVTADFNGDGVPDLATANAYLNLDVFLNNGQGLFTSSYHAVTGFNPIGLTAADLNGDGRVDLAVPTLAGISVFPGFGDGTFATPVKYAMFQTNPSYLLVADFDSDGIADLATGNGNGELSILLGNGDATFRAGPVYSIVDGGGLGGGPICITAGDFDLNGTVDLAVSTGSSTLVVFLGHGNGTFNAPTTVSAGAFVFSVVARDFDGDGKSDLAVGDGYYDGFVSEVRFMKGNGNGTFSPPIATGPLWNIPDRTDIAAGDFNGDGKLDLIASVANRDVHLLLGNGNGTFSVQTIDISGRVEWLPTIAVADYNRDGVPDFALLRGNGISVFLGTRPVDVRMTKTHAGNFQVGQTGASFTLTVSNSGPNQTTGPIQVDDLLPTGLTATALGGPGWACSLAQCRRFDALGPGASFPALTLTVNVAANTLPDVNNIATVNAAADTNLSNNTATDPVIVARAQTISFPPIPAHGLGDAPFQLRAFASSGLAVGYSASGNCGVIGNTVTITAQGSCTITASQPGDAHYFPAAPVQRTFSILPGSATSVSSSANPSIFGARVTLTATVTPSGSTGKVTFYDGSTILGTANLSGGQAMLQTALNATGNRQIVARYRGDSTHAGSASNGLSQTVNSARAFNFTSSANDVNLSVISVATGDFNGDGKPDLVGSGYGNSIRAILGNGAGTFGAPIPSTIPGGQFSQLTVADFDGDGKADVAGASVTDNFATISFGRGDGSFGEAISLSSGYGWVNAADFNLDGIPDLAVTGILSGNVSIYLGNGGRTFAEAIRYSVGEIPVGEGTAVAVGDVNGDGRPDLLATIPPASYGPTRTVVVLSGNGDGTFSRVSNVVSAGPYNPADVLALEDLNGDGKLDVVIGSYGPVINVLTGNGDGTFAPAVLYSAGDVFHSGRAWGLAMIDADGDGETDVLVDRVIEGPRNELQVFSGNGDGTVQPVAIHSPATLFLFGLIPADFNGDGRVDLASAHQSNSFDIRVFLGVQAPRLRISLTHVGNFVEGSSESFTIVVSNATGAATTSGIVTMNARIPGGLMLTSLSGPGWNCSGSTCTGGDALAAGASYPPITGIVQVLIGSTTTQANVASASGSGSMTSEVQDLITVVPAASCPFVINPMSVNRTAAGGTASVSVTAPSGCGWMAASNVAWLTITSGAAGSGNGTVNYSVITNTGGARSGTLTIAGKTFTVNQDASPPILTISFSHRGSLIAGQNNAQFIGSISNAGFATSGTVTFTANAPVGLTLVSVSGPGWTCGSTTCTRSDSLATSGAYPPITLVANIGAAAVAPLNFGVSISGGGSAPAAATDQILFTSALEFYPVTPCRVVDTRIGQGKTGAFGPPSLTPFVQRDFPILSGGCAIPGSARAYAINITAAPHGQLSFLSTWPTGQPFPGVSTLNSSDGSLVANATVVPAGTGGNIAVVAGDSTDLIIDINGYFAPPDSGAEFYTMTPCRIVDTRAGQGKTGPFGPPNLAAYAARDFPITTSPCGVPASAQSFSLNLTVLPPGPLSFLSTWPAGQGFPGVSTLNSPRGNWIANAALVPSGSNGSISVVAGEPTELIVDVNGYFGPSGPIGLNFYPITPCRLSDTRSGQGKIGAFGPPALSAFSSRDLPVLDGGCNIPASARAYAFNMTALPTGPLSFLSVWPSGAPYPGVSTLNSSTGVIAANMAFVPAGTNGAVTIVAGDPADLIVDITGYFAP